MQNPNNTVQALTEFDTSGAIEAADDMARAFETAADRIASALERAARAGEFSFSQMAESIARDLAKIAVQELITDPLSDLIHTVTSSVISGQGKAQTPNVNVTMNLSGVTDMAGVKKSETQFAAALTRALSTAQKLT